MPSLPQQGPKLEPTQVTMVGACMPHIPSVDTGIGMTGPMSVGDT